MNPINIFDADPKGSDVSTEKLYLQYKPDANLISLLKCKKPPNDLCESSLINGHQNGDNERDHYDTGNHNRHLGPAVLWTDPQAEKIRNACDYSIRFNMATAIAGKQTRTLRVYCEGVFDMFHYGHARMLWQAKSYFPGSVRLIVGISNEVDCGLQKRKPIMLATERIAAVSHCRYVDEVVPECPWFTGPDFFEKHKIDFFCHDEQSYSGNDDQPDVYGWIKEAGLFFATERTAHISTTDLINRLLLRDDLRSAAPADNNLECTTYQSNT